MDRVIQKKKSKLPLYAFIGSVAIIGTVLFLQGLYADASHKVESMHTAVSHVSLGNFEDVIPIRAAVEPIVSVFMDAVEGGHVESILIEEGEYVEKGDVILKLTNTRLQLDVVSREAEISRQISNLQNTRLAIEQNKLQLDRDLIDVDYEIDRNKRLLESYRNMKSENHYSEQEYKDAVNELTRWVERRKVLLESQELDKRVRATQLANLQSNIDHLQNNLVVVRSILEKLDVKAPISGRLTALNAELGQSILQGARIGQIDDETGFRTTAQVSEHYINLVQVGQLAEFTADSNHYLQRISKIYSQVSSGHFKIDLVFVGEIPENIRRGQKLSLKLKLSEAEERLVINNGPFFNDTGGAWVFVAAPQQNVFRKRLVTLGRRTPSQIEVIDGLLAGEKVLTSAYTNYLAADAVTVR